MKILNERNKIANILHSNVNNKTITIINPNKQLLKTTNFSKKPKRYNKLHINVASPEKDLYSSPERMHFNQKTFVDENISDKLNAPITTIHKTNIKAGGPFGFFGNRAKGDRIPLLPSDAMREKLPNIKVAKNAYVNYNFYPEFNNFINKPVKLKVNYNKSPQTGDRNYKNIMIGKMLKGENKNKNGYMFTISNTKTIKFD